ANARIEFPPVSSELHAGELAVGGNREIFEVAAAHAHPAVRALDLKARSDAAQLDAVVAQAVVLDLLKVAPAVQLPAVARGPLDEFVACHRSILLLEPGALELAERRAQGVGGGVGTPAAFAALEFGHHRAGDVFVAQAP